MPTDEEVIKRLKKYVITLIMHILGYALSIIVLLSILMLLRHEIIMEIKFHKYMRIALLVFPLTIIYITYNGFISYIKIISIKYAIDDNCWLFCSDRLANKEKWESSTDSLLKDVHYLIFKKENKKLKCKVNYGIYANASIGDEFYLLMVPYKNKDNNFLVYAYFKEPEKYCFMGVDWRKK